MATFKNRLADTLSDVAQLLPFSLLSKAATGKLLAPFYHAVSDTPMPHIRHLYRVKGAVNYDLAEVAVASTRIVASGHQETK